MIEVSLFITTILFFTIINANDVFVTLSQYADVSKIAILDADQVASSQITGTVCCGVNAMDTSIANVFGLAYSPLTIEIICLLRPKGQSLMTVAVIDPCSGATDYDATAFLLNDTAASSSAMPIAVDPTNGLVYMLQTFTDDKFWSLYRLNLTTRVQTLVRSFAAAQLKQAGFVTRCRDLIFDQRNTTLLYCVYGADDAGSMSYLMALNSTTGDIVFRSKSLGQADIHGLAVNSNGTLFGLQRVIDGSGPTQIFTIIESTTSTTTNQFTTKPFVSVQTVDSIQTTIAMPRSFSNCFASNGPASHLLLTNNGGTFVRYSKTPEFANGNRVALTSGMIRNTQTSINNYAFLVVAPLGTVAMRIDSASIDGNSITMMTIARSQSPCLIANVDVRFGRYNITLTAFRAGMLATSPVSIQFSLIDPTISTMKTTTTTKSTTTSTSTTTTTERAPTSSSSSSLSSLSNKITTSMINTFEMTIPTILINITNTQNNNNVTTIFDSSSTMISESQMNNNDDNNNNTITIIVIACSVVAVVLIVSVAIIIVVVCRRRHRTTTSNDIDTSMTTANEEIENGTAMEAQYGRTSLARI